MELRVHFLQNILYKVPVTRVNGFVSIANCQVIRKEMNVTFPNYWLLLNNEYWEGCDCQSRGLTVTRRV